jgi:hypothetical protein
VGKNGFPVAGSETDSTEKKSQAPSTLLTTKKILLGDCPICDGWGWMADKWASTCLTCGGTKYKATKC